jgi:hypothetical protein
MMLFLPVVVQAVTLAIDVEISSVFGKCLAREETPAVLGKMT